jgi:NADPH:quinone reductase-like Zn-dependent oxidoreductase
MTAVPKRMRAVAIERIGGPDVLQITELPTPQPGVGEVLVRVAYADVNPADWKCREGWLARYMTYRFPFVLGFDGAGTVVAVGADVDEFQIGDRVTGTANQLRGDWGSYAQFFKAAAGRLAKLPDTVDLRSAAAVPIAGVTAWEGIVEVCALQPGQQILINGGAGGVGSYAIQLGRVAGARVAATASAGNLDYLRSLGAERVIDYRNEDVAAAVRVWAPHGVDAVLDTVGQGSLPNAVELTRAGGVVSPVATLIEGEPTYNVADARARDIRIVVAMSNPQRAGVQLRELVALLAAGKLRAPHIETLPLAQVAEAHARIQHGHARGKLLLAVEADT